MIKTFVNPLLRKILFIQNPKISSEKAYDIAFQECEKRNIVWNPLIYEQLKFWVILAPKNIRGGQTYIKIDQQSGKIV